MSTKKARGATTHWPRPLSPRTSKWPSDSNTPKRSSPTCSMGSRQRTTDSLPSTIDSLHSMHSHFNRDVFSISLISDNVPNMTSQTQDKLIILNVDKLFGSHLIHNQKYKALLDLITSFNSMSPSQKDNVTYTKLKLLYFQLLQI